MDVNDTLVMKRREDSWMNATHILKACGLSKGRRLKILATEECTQEHEKVQGGWYKYQGTWIALNHARDLCRRYDHHNLIKPLLEYGTNNDNDVEISSVMREATAAYIRDLLSSSEQAANSQSSGLSDGADLTSETGDPDYHHEQGQYSQESGPEGVDEGHENHPLRNLPSGGIELPVLVSDCIPTSDPGEIADFGFGPAAFSGEETEAEVYLSLTQSTLVGIAYRPTSQHQRKLQNSRLRVSIAATGRTVIELREDGSNTLRSLLLERLERNDLFFLVRMEENL